ncbi:tetratricopeptide repeat protein [Thauera humireducens]|uniref:tetratricopeptide repeat protein n=1 Tax=Thauera humireducens TaxID=1134435 RepID=UPI0024A8D3AC|nr:tetratricopeptide repeat protein [Thauera humireducens]
MLATAPIQAAPTDADAPYLAAMQAIADGRYEDARTLLMQLAAQSPEHAGAWLDLAILQCGLGHAAEAEALFGVIELRFAPSAAIREVIAQQRASGCRPQAQPGRYQLRLSRGYDSNVNQGARDLNLLIGDGAGGGVMLELAPEYAARGDGFVNLQAEGRRPLSRNGTVGFGHVLLRHYDRLHHYDLSAVSGGLDHPLRLGTWDARLSATAGVLGLGGTMYQANAAWQAHVTPPAQPLPAGWAVSGLVGQAFYDYPGQSVFNARQTEWRGVLTYRGEGSALQLAAGPMTDSGRAHRPGGDRDGWSYSVWWRTPLWQRTFAELHWSRFDWRGSQAYAPGLIDTRRKQDTEQLRLTVTHPIDATHAVVAEYRQVDNHENISIFSYQARQFSLSWQWQY